jgi:hypothetical protein
MAAKTSLRTTLTSCSPILFFALLAPTEKVDLVALRAALDAHLRFLLLGVARRGHADDLFPVAVLRELLQPSIPFRLPGRHQVVMPARPDLR